MNIPDILGRLPLGTVSPSYTFSARKRVSGLAINVMSVCNTPPDLYFQFYSLSQKHAFRSEMSLQSPLDFQVHRHDYYEMMYVYKGEPRQQIEADCGQCEEGELYLLNRNIRHMEMYNTPATCIFFCLQKEFLFSILHELHPAHSARQFFEHDLQDASPANKQYMYYRPARTKQSKRILHQLIAQIMQELLEQKPGYQSILRGLIVRLLSELDRPGSYHTLYTLHDSHSQLFDRMAAYIQQYRGCLTRCQLEAEFNYSGDYLNRICKGQTGLSLTEYFNRVRLEAAASLLKQTDQTVYEIAETLQFQNKTHFYRLFKAQYGVTPQIYRKQIS